MLFQLTFLGYFITYAPIFIYLSFDIAILVFGIFIYKKNSYKYGLYLMISSIISIVSSVISISINAPYLVITLYNDYGLDYMTVSMILAIINIIFLALGVSSMILLFLAIYHVYKTHKPNREN